MLRRITLVLILVLISSNTAFATNNVNPVLKISELNSFFPVFSKDVKNYAIYDCHKKIIPFTITKGSVNIKFNDFFVNDQVRSYKGAMGGYNYDFTVRCLSNAWRFIDYKYSNYNKTEKGFILGKFMYDFSIVNCPEKISCKNPVTILYIVDNNGVPLWYRYFQGHSNFTGFQLNGSRLEWFATRYKELPPQGKSEVSGRVMSFDLKENSTLSSTIPHEVVNGVKIYPPIDFHDFKSTDKHFYFISFDDKLVDPNTLSNRYFIDNNNPDQARKGEICKSSDKVLLRGARIIRTDKKGLVNWSYAISNAPTYGVTINIRDEKNYTRCEIDVNHPNWLSLDTNEKNITVSLHNSGTYNISIDNKEINWLMHDDTNQFMHADSFDKSKLLKIINDPMISVTRTHSGSFINNSDLFLTFDNRFDQAELSRAVIYKIDKDNKKATFVKAFKPPGNKCSLVEQVLYCMVRTMGNATSTPTGEIIVNWGERPGGKNVYTVYDKDYNPILDVTFGSKAFYAYKHEYYDSSYFEKNFFSIDFLKSTNNKSNYLSYIKTKFICEQFC